MLDVIFSGVMTILGLIVGYYTGMRKNRQKYGGDIVVTKREDGKKVFRLELESDPEELENQKEVTFRIKTT